MVVNPAARLDAAFRALAHPTRRAMLRMLADGRERSVGELAAPFDISLAASSKHVGVLERARLVRRRVEGRTHACRIDPEPLAEVADWTETFRALWEPQFARLDGVLEELKHAASPRGGAGTTPDEPDEPEIPVTDGTER